MSHLVSWKEEGHGNREGGHKKRGKEGRHFRRPPFVLGKGKKRKKRKKRKEEREGRKEGRKEEISVGSNIWSLAKWSEVTEKEGKEGKTCLHHVFRFVPLPVLSLDGWWIGLGWIGLVGPHKRACRMTSVTDTWRYVLSALYRTVIVWLTFTIPHY
jgi:hypothetical protein